MITLADKFTSRLAQLTPFAKREDDPLASPKAATRWLDNLPVGDPLKCQQTIVGAIRRLNENSSQWSKDRLAVLMLLDERSRDLQDTLVRQYLRNPRMSRQVENQLWHAVYGLCWEIARGYQTFALHPAREEGGSQQGSPLPLATLRAIRAFGQLLKWDGIRYLPAAERYWLNLHELYRLSEQRGFARKAQRAYPDDSTEFSCESAYLHILMFDLASSGTLYPRQLDLLDRWLCGWQALLRLDDYLDPDSHTFAVDLGADHGPRRVRKPDDDRPLRAWATGSLVATLNGLQADLHEGKLPAELGLTEFARSGESLELLSHLQYHWAPLATREQRRAARESVKRLVDVTHGLGGIINQVRGADATPQVSPYGTGLDSHGADDVQVFGFVTERTRARVAHLTPSGPHSPDVERWVMQDESECGYGAVVASSDKDWLRVGALLGIKSHDDEAWRVGIVRRLSRHGDDSSSVGIEIIADAPALAMLYDIATPGYTVDGFDNTGAALPHSSLWLGGTSASLLLDPVHFSPEKVFRVHGIPDRKLIALGSPVERSEGWMRVQVDPVKG